MGTSPQELLKINSHRERREVGREPRNKNNLLPIHANSEDDMKQFRTENYFRDSKNAVSRKKEERKSNSDTHSPFGSFNDQNLPSNPIDDYGRTWTSATLATPCDNDFWETQEPKRQSPVRNETTPRGIEDYQRISKEESKIHESTSEIIKNVKLTYLSASSLSDDRWIWPIWLDIFDDAVETPCCHNLFWEKCIMMANISNELQNK